MCLELELEPTAMTTTAEVIFFSKTIVKPTIITVRN